MEEIEGIVERTLQRITQLRLQRNISEKQLCRDIGKTTGYLSSLNRNKSIPSIRTLVTICDYFGISLNEFFDEENQYPILVREINEELLSMGKEDLEMLLQLAKRINSKE